MGSNTAADAKAWLQLTSKYQTPDPLRSGWQLLNSLVPYVALWYLMFRSLEVSYWLTLALAPLAAGFMIRLFIIFHDCGHGAFFKSKRLSNVVGYVTGVMTFTPYFRWRHDHAKHHATSGDLDRRDLGGEIWTLTVEEYLASSLMTRLRYRAYRHPLVMFLIGPMVLFAVAQRLTNRREHKRERASVWWTNLGVVVLVGSLIATMGLKAYVMIQLPISLIGGAVGVWLFYVQHQFESVYWERHDVWEYLPAALHGSSYYELPRVLQWFSGNIGYHHIHHLCPRIPNYFLQRCHEENPSLAAIPSITLLSSLRSLGFRLWDEERRQMVGFGYLRGYKRAQA